MKNWYALYVRPRTEKKVSVSFGEKNLEHYLPLRKCLHQWSDRKKWVELPVISGYVFVKIAPNERLDVLKTDFVLGFVRYLGTDALIPEDQMNTMKCILSQPDIQVGIDFSNYPKGQPVRIIAGPLLGLIGNLYSGRNQKKILIRIEQINMNMIIEIPGSHVEIINDSKFLGN
jgi:transcription antitermination factor NusG